MGLKTPKFTVGKSSPEVLSIDSTHLFLIIFVLPSSFNDFDAIEETTHRPTQSSTMLLGIFI